MQKNETNIKYKSKYIQNIAIALNVGSDNEQKLFRISLPERLMNQTVI